MENLDKIISVLYLAKSGNRERMLSDLILNVLYSINEPMPFATMLSFIKVTFHLEPMEYEVQESLNQLVENKEVILKDKLYSLSESSK